MIRRILLTLDGSKSAEQAVGQAELQVRSLEAELHVLQVVRPAAESQRAGMTPVSVLESVERDLRLLAENYLDGIAEQLRARGLAVKTAVTYGQPHNEIIRYAKENQIDLIVMATRGASGITRWLLGTVTDQVVRGSPIPVLVVPLKDSGK